MSASEHREPRCSYCGLPLARRLWRSRREAADEPAYCCFGCRFAADVAGSRGPQGEANSTLARLGLAVFLTINVVMFTMALWTQDVYGFEAKGAAAWSGPLAAVFRYLALVLSLGVLWLLGRPLADAAWRSVRRGDPSTDVLLVLGVAASYVYSLVSVVRGEGHVYFEVGCVVLVMVTLGRWLEATGKLRATAALDELEKLLPERVRVVRGAEETLAPLSEVRRGDRLRVLAGERFAVDGRIVRGRAAVDEQVFTGESEPSVKDAGDRVLSGTLDLDGEVLVEVTAAAGFGALRRLIEAVENARLAKGDYQRLADRLAHGFLPAVAAIALAGAAWHGWYRGIDEGILVGLAVVLIACPCALGLATPLAAWAALGRAAGCQVLFRHGAALERLAGVRAMAFDKTGTLTTGTARLAAFAADQPAESDAVLLRAAELAAGSSHGYSAAIRQMAEPRLLASASIAPDELRTLPGRGLMASFAAARESVYLGSPRLMKEMGLAAGRDLQRSMDEWTSTGRSLACVGWRGRVRGVFGFDEQLRGEVREALDACRRLGLHVSVLTGDAVGRARRLGDELGVAVSGGLLPQDKVVEIERLRKSHGATAMVGEGINDAPALAAADVGMALGCGADVSRQTADVCLLTNDLQRVAWSVGLARATVRVIRQNLFWAFFYNTLGIALAVSGRLNPVWAAVAMVASSVLVIGNSLRLSTWNS